MNRLDGKEGPCRLKRGDPISRVSYDSMKMEVSLCVVAGGLDDPPAAPAR